MRMVAFLILSLGLTPSALAETVRIAAASNFTAPAKSLGKLFQQETGHQVKFSFGSTGKLYAQIRYGAPFDIFMSADHQRPELLVEEDLAEAGSFRIYARGRLALWSREPNLNVLDLLKKNDYRKLSVANPKTAPYGLAAIEALPKLTGSDLPKDKLVYGENIAQTYQFAYSGNAQLGMIAWSQIKQAPNTGSFWLVPANLHAPINQAVVQLASSLDNPAAKAFLDFLRHSDSQDLIRSYGYDLPALDGENS